MGTATVASNLERTDIGFLLGQENGHTDVAPRDSHQLLETKCGNFPEKHRPEPMNPV